MTQAEWLEQAIREHKHDAHSVLVGFDGFVDDIVHLVDERQDIHQFTRLNKMSDFADRVAKASGKSCNIEMHITRSKIGGNGPILANALSAQGKSITYVGAIGDKMVHPVFADFANSCKDTILMTDPGRTNAFEFHDGKVMIGTIQTMEDITWERLIDKIGEKNIVKTLDKMDLIACVNWTMTPYMNGILKGMKDAVKQLKKKKTFFIDLTDPRKRTGEDIKAVLTLLSEFKDEVELILGLNEAESSQVAEHLGLKPTESLQMRAESIRDAMGIHLVVIHPVRGAALASEHGIFEIDGPYTPTPNLTTGAGDNFNAGFCAGYLSGLPPEVCLLTGVCTSGYYVRHCHSPSHFQLIEFMKKWAESGCGFI